MSTTRPFPPPPHATLQALARLKAAHHRLLGEYLASPGTIARLARAMELLTQDTQYTVTVRWHDDRYLYKVTKEERDRSPVTYTVDLRDEERTCTCPDGQRVRHCKHSLAVRVLLLSAED